jgi:hypothetical protein
MKKRQALRSWVRRRGLPVGIIDRLRNKMKWVRLDQSGEAKEIKINDGPILTFHDIAFHVGNYNASLMAE